MIIVMKDLSRWQTKSGSNIVFSKTEYVIKWLSPEGKVMMSACKDIIQIEPQNRLWSVL